MTMLLPQTLHRKLATMLLRTVMGAPRQVAPLSTSTVCRSLKPVQVMDDHPSMFSWTTLKKNYGIAPILVIVSATVICQIMWIMRTAVTRDDVRYTSKQEMLCETKDLDRAAPPIRKFRVYNQKYVVTEELYNALQALKPPTTTDVAAK